MLEKIQMSCLGRIYFRAGIIDFKLIIMISESKVINNRINEWSESKCQFNVHVFKYLRIRQLAYIQNMKELKIVSACKKRQTINCNSNYSKPFVFVVFVCWYFFVAFVYNFNPCLCDNTNNQTGLFHFFCLL